jgi:hypothetical protein
MQQKVEQLLRVREENAVLRAEISQLQLSQQEAYSLHAYVERLSSHVEQQLLKNK